MFSKKCDFCLVFGTMLHVRLVETDRRFRGAFCLDYLDRKHLWNVGQFLSHYTAQHPRKQSSSYSS